MESMRRQSLRRRKLKSLLPTDISKSSSVLTNPITVFKQTEGAEWELIFALAHDHGPANYSTKEKCNKTSILDASIHSPCWLTVAFHFTSSIQLPGVQIVHQHQARGLKKIFTGPLSVCISVLYSAVPSCTTVLKLQNSF